MLAALAADCLAQMGSNAEQVAAGNDDEFLHQLRVGMRRLRSLLRLVGRVTGKDAIDALVTELRWLGSVLGPARDWDVFATETRRGGPGRHAPSHAAQGRRTPSLSRDAGARALSQRGDDRRCVRALRPADAQRRPVLRHAAVAHRRVRITATAHAREFAQGMLTKHARALHKRGKRLRAAAPPERHRVRIAAKKLRYTAEFFAPLFSPRRARAYVKTLAKLQGVLGKLNDIATAQRLIDDVAPPAVHARQRGACGRRGARLDCRLRNGEVPASTRHGSRSASSSHSGTDAEPYPSQWSNRFSTPPAPSLIVAMTRTRARSSA